MVAKTDVNTYRVAVSGDEAGILKVFAEVAPEVPTAVRSGTEKLIQGLVASGQSWVAVDVDDNIVGYVLAEPYDSKTLSLAYLGVSKAARNQRVSSSLISKLQEIGAPIVTDVRANNKSSMVEIFEHFGFVKMPPDVFSADRTKLRWDKPKKNPPA
jgi:ribosomal protein S18 acetylase RimI-like enzyme